MIGVINSSIRFENESDGRFDSRFDSNEKKTIRRSLRFTNYTYQDHQTLPINLSGSTMYKYKRLSYHRRTAHQRHITLKVKLIYK